MSEQPWNRNEGKYAPTSGVPERSEPLSVPMIGIDPELERESLRGIQPLPCGASILASHDALGEDVEIVEGEPADTPSHSMLRSFIERIERLDDEIADIRADRKDVVAEAKAQGFDPAALREVIKRRKQDPDKLAGLDAMVETYEIALGGVGRGMVWGGEIRPQPRIEALKRTDRTRKAEEAAAISRGVRQARLG